MQTQSSRETWQSRSTENLPGQMLIEEETVELQSIKRWEIKDSPRIDDNIPSPFHIFLAF